jgi:hypothetical protein
MDEKQQQEQQQPGLFGYRSDYDLAKAFERTVACVRGWLDRDGVKFRKIGNRRFYADADIEAWMAGSGPTHTEKTRFASIRTRIILDTVMPNGKRLGDCTVEEVKAARDALQRSKKGGR